MSNFKKQAFDDDEDVYSSEIFILRVNATDICSSRNKVLDRYSSDIHWYFKYNRKQIQEFEVQLKVQLWV